MLSHKQSKKQEQPILGVRVKGSGDHLHASSFCFCPWLRPVNFEDSRQAIFIPETYAALWYKPGF